jgi:hypothetical protein
MVADTVAAFHDVGLEVGTEKTYWTCWPPTPDATLQVGADHVPWESNLVFVGCPGLVWELVCSSSQAHRAGREDFS